MQKGAIVLITIIAGLGLGILGWAQAESVHVAEIKPLSEAIHVANKWMVLGIGGGILMGIGFVLLATGWAKGK
jgi:hypothetical protein